MRSLPMNDVYDAPFFKRLKSNDLPSARGHQGGIFIPKDLRPYLPALDAAAAAPTVKTELTLDLVVDGESFGTTRSVYRFQTWGRTRQVESRLTSNLRSFLETARPDDLLVLRRRSGSTSRYLAELIRGAEADQLLGSRGSRWGALDPVQRPAFVQVLDEASDELLSREQASPFTEGPRGSTLQERLHRSDAFRLGVRKAYGANCAVCTVGLRLSSSYETQGAHIVPVGRGGSDEIVNGLCLCGSHHWAFDHGAIWFDSQFRMRVTPDAQAIQENAPLLKLEGTALSLPHAKSHRPAPVALAWHAQHIAGVE